MAENSSSYWINTSPSTSRGRTNWKQVDHDDAWGITAGKNVYFRAKNVDDRENIAKIEKKFPKTIPGPTRMLCVNFSPIGSVVLEKLGKKRLFCAKRSMIEKYCEI